MQILELLLCNGIVNNIKMNRKDDATEVLAVKAVGETCQAWMEILKSVWYKNSSHFPTLFCTWRKVLPVIVP